MSDNKGWPIFLDPLNRSLVDTASEGDQLREWHPMNGCAQRLYRCKEALQDMEERLEEYNNCSEKTKRRRRLRGLAVPMHSLALGLVDLINMIQSETQVHSRLPSGATSTLTTLRSRLVTLVPFDRNGKLGILRNKLVAHYDKDFSPAEMRDLDSQTDSTEMGEWLHICLFVFCDLLKLDAYMWTAVGPRRDTTVNMCQEPLVTVMRIEGEEIVGIEGFYMSKVSPRALVFSHIETVASLSQTLFERASRYQIGGFTPDSAQDWARTLSST